MLLLSEFLWGSNNPSGWEYGMLLLCRLCSGSTGSASSYTQATIGQRTYIRGNGKEALFNLNCPNGLPTLRDQYRLSDPEVNRMIRALVPYIPQLCTTWEEMHGKQKPN